MASCSRRCYTINKSIIDERHLKNSLEPKTRSISERPYTSKNIYSRDINLTIHHKRLDDNN